jgi:hypothetical protein
MARVEDELELQGLLDVPPSIERIRVFSSAFSEVIDKLPSYRQLLLAVQKEYDVLIARLHAEVNAAAPIEARLRTMKVASLSYVGESMAWFQIEIENLRKQLKTSDTHITTLKTEIAQHEHQKSHLEGASETAKFVAKESHNQNLDILRHMDRMEKQVELLRKQDKEAQGQNNTLQMRIKEKDSRIVTVEGQLEAERLKVASMVPREDLDAANEEIAALEQKLYDLQQSFNAKQRDYMSIVEVYNKVTGQTMDKSAVEKARPLTPRPSWYPCSGLLDPDYQHTVDRAEHGQEILHHMLACSRTVLSAYGLAVAASKSHVFTDHAKHPLTLTIASTPAECRFLNRNHDISEDGPDADKNEKSKASAMLRDGDEFIPADVDAETPQVFHHDDQIKNLRFSRRRVSDIIESLMSQRSSQKHNSLAKPFCEFLLENAPEEVPEEDRHAWGVNVYSSLRRYSAEPDLLAYMLLLKGKVSDSVVRDNRRLCGELLKIFTHHFESSDGSRNITKQKFFYGLREVLSNKEKEMWQDLVTYFPAGGAELLVNYEWLLFDDMYVLSPIVYALRLQHLEECMSLIGRLEKLVRSCAEDGSVTCGQIEEAFRDDSEFGLINTEDIARAFDCRVDDLKPETSHDVEQFLAVLKQGDIFRILYFPALASDDPDLAAQGDEP